MSYLPHDEITRVGVLLFSADTNSDQFSINSGDTALFVTTKAGRNFLATKSSYVTLFGEDISNARVTILMPNRGTVAPVPLGVAGAVTAGTTLTHPAATQQYGYGTNFSGATAGWIESSDSYILFSNLFYRSTISFPDSFSTYTAQTGTRFFAGLSTQTGNGSTSADDPTGSRIGFSFIYNSGTSRQDLTFKLTTKDGSNESLFDTQMYFSAGCIYKFYLFSEENLNYVNFRIENVTNLTYVEGTVESNLPASTTNLKATHTIANVNSGNRMFRLNGYYISTQK